MSLPAIGTAPARISLAPWTVIGERADGRPIYVIAGGAEDDDTGIEVDDGVEEEEPDDEAESAEEPEEEAPKPKPAAKKDPVAEKLEAELARTRAALKKANDDAKRHRLALKDREERDRANEGETEKALREAREEAENRWKPRIVNQAARAALAEAGVVGGPDRVLKLLDTQALSVDDDGDVIGLDSEVDRLRGEYPEFFAKPEDDKPKARPRPTGAPKAPAPEKPKNSWEAHAARVLRPS